MRRFIFIVVFLLSVVGCVGQKEDPVNIVLKSDRSEINVTAGESAVFSVLFNGEDVTEFADISFVSGTTSDPAIDKNIFTPSEEGSWTFAATYDGYESEPLTVTAFVVQEEGKDFFRRSLVLDFTATWCVNCPRMEAAFAAAMEARPGRLVPVSVHFVDAFAVEEGTALVTKFGVSEYPTAVIDMDPSSAFTTTSSELLLSGVDKLLAARPLAGGIRMESGADGSVKVEITAVEAGDYTINVMLLKDGEIAPQTGGETNHVHNNILRQHLKAESVHLDEE
ncbi:MAG: Omp28-related outer membrane protein, partial [Bacteroidales bacterium]|nr:Omp28-related outer membrane protein [Bacteroidales bacterium]